MEAPELRATVSPTVGDYRKIFRDRFLTDRPTQQLLVIIAIAFSVHFFVPEPSVSGVAGVVGVAILFLYASALVLALRTAPQRTFATTASFMPTTFAFGKEHVTIENPLTRSVVAYEAFERYVVIDDLLALVYPNGTFFTIPERDAGAAYEGIVANVAGRVHEAKTLTGKIPGVAAPEPARRARSEAVVVVTEPDGAAERAPSQDLPPA